MTAQSMSAWLIAGSLALATVASAQTTSGSGTGTTTTPGTSSGTTSPSAGSATTGQSGAPTVSTSQAVGTVQRMDDQTLVLDDGTEFSLPPAQNVVQFEVKDGMKVRVTYREEGGRKVVTAIDPAS